MRPRYWNCELARFFLPSTAPQYDLRLRRQPRLCRGLRGFVGDAGKRALFPAPCVLSRALPETTATPCWDAPGRVLCPASAERLVRGLVSAFQQEEITWAPST